MLTVRFHDCFITFLDHFAPRLIAISIMRLSTSTMPNSDIGYKVLLCWPEKRYIAISSCSCVNTLLARLHQYFIKRIFTIMLPL